VRPVDDRRGPRMPNRVHDQIRARTVLVIDDAGNPLGTMPIFDALREARERGLDLVEVSPNAVPPVCRIIDYGRQQYDSARKEREARKKQRERLIALKEVRVRPKTDPHDLETKLRAITKWLQEGDRVQLTLRMRGREQAHPDVGRKVLTDMATAVGEIGRIERDVLSEGRQMTLVLAPNPAVVKRPVRPASPGASPDGLAPGSPAQ